MRIIIGLCVVAFLCFESPSMASDKVMVSTLLDEMISFEKATEFPEPYYTCKMVSSMTAGLYHRIKIGGMLMMTDLVVCEWILFRGE